MFLMNHLSNGNNTLDDIYALTSEYKGLKSDCKVDLPIDFLKKPTYSDYLKASRTNEVKAVDRRMGVFRLFSLKYDNEEENRQEEKTETELR